MNNTKELIITILHTDFNDDYLDSANQYITPKDCPLARAIKRQLNTDDVSVSCTRVIIDRKDWHYEGNEWNSLIADSIFMIGNPFNLLLTT